MKLILVAAVAANGVIGADGNMPWRLPEDLRRFKSLTMGHPMVMGRKTFDSIGRALPGRRTVVVTRQPGWAAPGVEVADSVEQALQLAAAGNGAADEPVMIVGGGEIYRATIGLADRLEITHVETEVAGDTTFPAIEPALWEVTDRDQRAGFAFATYRRRPAPMTDLTAMLAGLDAQMHDGEFVFCTAAAVPDGLDPVVTVAEAEGVTFVVRREDAAAAGILGTFPCSWITLAVPSALHAVGLTAAVAVALTRDEIPCNMVAGFHHDHLFVPVDRIDDALTALAHTRP